MNDYPRRKLAIVGAGVSGLAAAWALRDADWHVTVFEKSRGVSGRAASRSGNDARYDHGANYFKTDSPELEQLILRELPTEGLIDIAGDVWIFDQYGTIAPGDSKQNAEPKWNYRQGISTLGKNLFEQSGAQLMRESRVESLVSGDDGEWELFKDDGNSLGVFDAVLLTPPAPQVMDLLRISELPDEQVCEDMRGMLDDAKYHSQFSLVLGFHAKLPRPEGCYAMINEDREHAISWLSFEDAKPGRVPEGETVVIAQMSPAWTAEHYDADLNTLQALATEAIEGLLELTGLRAAWFDSQRWKYAHPYASTDFDDIHEIAPEGLFFAGDSFVGKGRVGASIETGLWAAERILEM